MVVGVLLVFVTVVVGIVVLLVVVVLVGLKVIVYALFEFTVRFGLDTEVIGVVLVVVELVEVDGTVEDVVPYVFVVVVTVVVLVVYGAVTVVVPTVPVLVVVVGVVVLMTAVSTVTVFGKLGDSLMTGLTITGVTVVAVPFELLVLFAGGGMVTIFLPPIAPKPNNKPSMIPASARSPSKASKGFGHRLCSVSTLYAYTGGGCCCSYVFLVTIGVDAAATVVPIKGAAMELLTGRTYALVLP